MSSSRFYWQSFKWTSTRNPACTPIGSFTTYKQTAITSEVFYYKIWFLCWRVISGNVNNVNSVENGCSGRGAGWRFHEEWGLDELRRLERWRKEILSLKGKGVKVGIIGPGSQGRAKDPEGGRWRRGSQERSPGIPLQTWGPQGNHGERRLAVSRKRTEDDERGLKDQDAKRQDYELGSHNGIERQSGVSGAQGVWSSFWEGQIFARGLDSV